MGLTSIEICPPEVAANMLAMRAKSASVKRLTSDYSMDSWALGCMLYQMITQSLLLADILGASNRDDVLGRDLHDNLRVWKDVTQEQVRANTGW